MFHARRELNEPQTAKLPLLFHPWVYHHVDGHMGIHPAVSILLTEALAVVRSD